MELAPSPVGEAICEAHRAAKFSEGRIAEMALLEEAGSGAAVPKLTIAFSMAEFTVRIRATAQARPLGMHLTHQLQLAEVEKKKPWNQGNSNFAD
jgi:hypothetical protein